jgi:hypothetical protein
LIIGALTKLLLLLLLLLLADMMDLPELCGRKACAADTTELVCKRVRMRGGRQLRVHALAQVLILGHTGIQRRGQAAAAKLDWRR